MWPPRRFAIDQDDRSVGVAPPLAKDTKTVAKRNATPPPAPGRMQPPAWRTWLAIGATGFGGPAGQLAILHREVVDRRRWMTDEEFVAAAQFCALLPGPEAQQLATYAGWRTGGLRGGLLAGTLFVLPGAAIVTAVAWLHAAGGDLPLVAAAFAGTRPAVVALVVMAAWRLGRRAITSDTATLICLLAAIAFACGASLPVVVAVAAAWGWLVPGSLTAARAAALAGTAAPAAQAGNVRRAWRVAAWFVAVWTLAYTAVRLLGPAGGRGASLAELFTQTTLLSFGGAYTVVPWALDEGVARGWLGPVERADALAAGEATPGPLILVVTFIGFLAGWKSGTANPALAGLEGAAVATLFAFIPSFAMVLALAPFVRSIMVARRPAAALAAVGAVVVAAIAVLSLTLARDAFLPAGRLDPLALAVAGVALVVLARRRASAPLVVAAAAAVGALAAS
jgi:chromate transporter